MMTVTLNSTIIGGIECPYRVFGEGPPCFFSKMNSLINPDPKSCQSQSSLKREVLCWVIGNPAANTPASSFELLPPPGVGNLNITVNWVNKGSIKINNNKTLPRLSYAPAEIKSTVVLVLDGTPAVGRAMATEGAETLRLLGNSFGVQQDVKDLWSKSLDFSPGSAQNTKSVVKFRFAATGAIVLPEIVFWNDSCILLRTPPGPPKAVVAITVDAAEPASPSPVPVFLSYGVPVLKSVVRYNESDSRTASVTSSASTTATTSQTSSVTGSSSSTLSATSVPTGSSTGNSTKSYTLTASRSSFSTASSTSTESGSSTGTGTASATFSSPLLMTNASASGNCTYTGTTSVSSTVTMTASSAQTQTSSQSGTATMTMTSTTTMSATTSPTTSSTSTGTSAQTPTPECKSFSMLPKPTLFPPSSNNDISILVTGNNLGNDNGESQFRVNVSADLRNSAGTLLNMSVIWVRDTETLLRLPSSAGNVSIVLTLSSENLEPIVSTALTLVYDLPYIDLLTLTDRWKYNNKNSNETGVLVYSNPCPCGIRAANSTLNEGEPLCMAAELSPAQSITFWGGSFGSSATNNKPPTVRLTSLRQNISPMSCIVDPSFTDNHFQCRPVSPLAPGLWSLEVKFDLVSNPIGEYRDGATKLLVWALCAVNSYLDPDTRTCLKKPCYFVDANKVLSPDSNAHADCAGGLTAPVALPGYQWYKPDEMESSMHADKPDTTISKFNVTWTYDEIKAGVYLDHVDAGTHFTNTIFVIECPVAKTRCSENNTCDFAHGYLNNTIVNGIATNPLCTRCLEGFAPSIGGTCVNCGDLGKPSAIILLALILAAILLAPSLLVYMSLRSGARAAALAAVVEAREAKLAAATAEAGAKAVAARATALAAAAAAAAKDAKIAPPSGSVLGDVLVPSMKIFLT